MTGTTVTHGTTAGPALDPPLAEANEALVRAGYAAFAAGDMATLERVFDPAITWHVQRLGMLSGDHEGWPAVQRFFGDTMRLTEGTFRVAVEHAFRSERGVVCQVRSTARRGRAELDDRQLHEFLVTDGRVTEVFQYVGGAGVDSFWT
jgi:ketosteroid isomerase-like protein